MCDLPDLWASRRAARTAFLLADERAAGDGKITTPLNCVWGRLCELLEAEGTNSKQNAVRLCCRPRALAPRVAAGDAARHVR